MSHSIGQGTVRVGGAIAIPRVLRNLGADPAKVLAEAGIDPNVFDDPDNLISNATRIHLLNLCVARTGCRHFGLLVGQQTGLPDLGPVGFLVQNSPDAGTALRNLVRYLHLHVRGAAPTLEIYGNLAYLGYEVHQSEFESIDQLTDAALAVAFNIVRTLCGPDWKPIQVQFAHREPEDVGPYRQHFCAPLLFDDQQNALVFSSDWLHRRLSGADPQLQRLLQKQIDALEARYGDDFPEQVRSILGTALLTDHARADQVAALFSMHSRTMNRRLNAFGTSFQELVDEGSYVLARQMLESSAMGVSEIAAALGYADASSFTRAFRSWSGSTPARWRAEGKLRTRHKK